LWLTKPSAERKKKCFNNSAVQKQQIIGIDLGATNIRGALVEGENATGLLGFPIRSNGTQEEVLLDLFQLTDQLMHPAVAAIGIGVPSVVDVKEGIVYDVQYIPSWKQVHLKQLMEARYNVPVLVNNDANCFALGEYYFGKGRGEEHMVGLTLGTGIGAGIIINKHLYAGVNCGAGEFGMAPYLEHQYEYYASGQFFQNIYGANGQDVFERAQQGNAEALEWYAIMGKHLGNTIQLVLYTYDPPLIVLGGSVRHAYRYFQEAMFKQIKQFAYPKTLEKLRIAISDLQNSGILGAAALYYDAGL
jgi:glucokinase